MFHSSDGNGDTLKVTILDSTPVRMSKTPFQGADVHSIRSNRYTISGRKLETDGKKIPGIVVDE